MTPLEILTGARSVLNDPQCWCRLADARDERGLQIKATNPDAVSWCLYSALRVVAGDDRNLLRPVILKLDGMLGEEWRSGYDEGIMAWNDAPERNHQEVIDFLDRAIEGEKNDSR